MDGAAEVTSTKEAGINRFQLKVEDDRTQKDSTQAFSLAERLKVDKVDLALTDAKKFPGSYSTLTPQELAVNIVDGNVGEGIPPGRWIYIDT